MIGDGVIVPVYNECASIGRLLERLQKKNLTVIVVDDGSTDETASIIETFPVIRVGFKQNLGKGAAIKAGLRTAKEHGLRKVVIMDGDLQHDPEQIPDFFSALDQADIAAGVRRKSGSSMPLTRRLSNGLSSFAVSLLCGRKIPDVQCGYRGVLVERAVAVQTKGNRFEYEPEFLICALRAGYSIKYIPIETRYNENRESKIRPTRDLIRFLLMFFRIMFSSRKVLITG